MPQPYPGLIATLFIVIAVGLPLARRASRSTGGRLAHGVALVSGVAYGVIGRLIFGFGHGHVSGDLPDWARSSFSVMSVSFLFLIPFAVGVLDQIARVPPGTDETHRWVIAFFRPMVPVLMMFGLMALIALEGAICLVMALPVFLFIAGIGGWIGMLVRRSLAGKARRATLVLALLLPYAASPLEQLRLPPTETREVQNAVHVGAFPETVWREIKSVRPILPAELPFRVAHFIGLPRPIEATLSQDGLGGIRIATFERGLRFRETVTRWEPGAVLSFAIQAEPAPPSALDEHVAVGGPYFDVLDGTYRLSAASDGGTLLVLTSHQRLSTRFNPYAGLWTDFIMSDLQSAILDVIRKRCELRHPSR